MNVGDAVLTGRAPNAQERIDLLKEQRILLAETLRRAHELHKKYYDKKHKATRFKQGDMVLLSSQNIRQLRPNKKLSDKFLGPFEVLEVRGEHGQAYKLKLPTSYRIHDVFHVSLLEPWHSREGVVIDPAPIEVADQLLYNVEAIVAHRDTKQGRRYLVKWQGYASSHNTWEPTEHLQGVDTFLEDYLKTNPAPLPEKKTGRRRNRRQAQRIARLRFLSLMD